MCCIHGLLQVGSRVKDIADVITASEAQHMYNETIKYSFAEFGVRVYRFVVLPFLANKGLQDSPPEN